MKKSLSNPILNAPTPNQLKLELLHAHFPQALETDADGRIRVNAEALQLALDPSNPAGLQVEEDGYELRWVGKREAYHSAFVPVQKILSPAPEQSKHWDSTGNLLLKGDNLDALRLLRHSYFGKVKLIYIDPPYNTQSDAFIYRDDFSARQSEVLAQLGYAKENIDYIKNIYGARTHSGWLSFMYPRLLLAKDLLRDDGVIFISIDDNEQAQLKLLCDEVFGQDNFVADVLWQKKYAVSNDDPSIGVMHDHVMVYKKSDAFARNLMPRTNLQNARYSNPDKDKRGEWASDNYVSNKSKTERPSLWYSITHPKTGEEVWPDEHAVWRYSKEKHLAMVQEDRLYWGPNLSYKRPRLKRYLNEVQQGIVPTTWWTFDECGHNDEAQKETAELLAQKVFSTPKPIRLLQKIIRLGSGKDDIVLDFFAGSGTTAEAVMRLNAEDGGTRQFILVQIPQPIDPKKQKEAHHFVTHTLGKKEATIFEITAERIRRAGAKLEAEQAAKALVSQAQANPVQPELAENFGNTESTASTAPCAVLDTGFRVFELVDDPDALILQKPLQQATQDDVLALLSAIATPQPQWLPRVLYNLLLSENLPLTT
ncbi:site-specific DNA-methyltransferase, partial [Rhodoferax sp.]|uniref:site-specific DNA-methyltransferase n=1 Tax=Rhodoferax sp. TaxID=50421 RepID=UPI00261EE355